MARKFVQSSPYFFRTSRIYSPIREISSGLLVSCPYNRLVIPSVGTGYCLSEIAKIRFPYGKVNSYYFSVSFVPLWL